jgi:hypothetical protein
MNNLQLLKQYFTAWQKKEGKAFSYVVLFWGPFAFFFRRQVRLGVISLALSLFLATHYVLDIFFLLLNLTLAFIANPLRQKGF